MSLLLSVEWRIIIPSGRGGKSLIVLSSVPATSILVLVVLMELEIHLKYDFILVVSVLDIWITLSVILRRTSICDLIPAAHAQ